MSSSSEPNRNLNPTWRMIPNESAGTTTGPRPTPFRRHGRRAGNTSQTSAGRIDAAHRLDLVPDLGRTYAPLRPAAGEASQTSQLSRSQRNARQLRLQLQSQDESQ